MRNIMNNFPQRSEDDELEAVKTLMLHFKAIPAGTSWKEKFNKAQTILSV